MDYSTRSEWTTDKSSACVCFFQELFKKYRFDKKRTPWHTLRFLKEEEEEEPLLIYTAQGSPFRCKKLSVINGSPERNKN